jgi:hypothetical protein
MGIDAPKPIVNGNNDEIAVNLVTQVEGEEAVRLVVGGSESTEPAYDTRKAEMRARRILVNTLAKLDSQMSQEEAGIELDE